MLRHKVVTTFKLSRVSLFTDSHSAGGDSFFSLITWKLITVFINARHFTLSWATLIQSVSPLLTSVLTSTLFLPSHLHLHIPDFFDWGSSVKMFLYVTSHFLHACYMPCPSHSPWLNVAITNRQRLQSVRHS